MGIKAQNDTLVHGRPDTLETYRLSRQTNETGSKANDETLRQGVLKEMLQHGRDVDSIGTTSQWSTKQTTWVSTRQIRQRDTTEETSGEYERGFANGVAGTHDRPISLRVRRRGGKIFKKE